MADPSGNPFAAADIDALLASREDKEALRFIPCGAADGGKSPLLDRLAGTGPENPVLRIDTTALSANLAADEIVALLSSTLPGVGREPGS